MKYTRQDALAAHVTLSNAIMYHRGVIAQHYKTITKLQERILSLGTEAEQTMKRLKIRSAVIDINNED